MGNFLVPFKKNRTTLKKLKIKKTLSQTHLKGEAPESQIVGHILALLF